jgi:hypothetical protein
MNYINKIKDLFKKNMNYINKIKDLFKKKLKN